jgi:CubicO group peptidase (beta-lactamase class C family)
VIAYLCGHLEAALPGRKTFARFQSNLLPSICVPKSRFAVNKSPRHSSKFGYDENTWLRIPPIILSSSEKTTMKTAKNTAKLLSTARLLTLVLVALITATNAFAQQNGQQNVQQIDSLMKQYYDYGQFNGSILVAEKGKIIYEKGFGMANMEWSIPNQPDTKFRIGSVTKQFTATLILQLVEEGKIKLDGKLSDYLPDYRKDTGDKITIHQLLNHTSGIPSYTSNPEFFPKYSRDAYGVADFVKKFASGDLEFEPGSKYSYNNSAYTILGAIIEKVTGKTYETVLTERIFKPLGMTNSGYDHHATLLQKRAGGYQKTAAGYVNAPYLDMSLPYSAGSIYSTVDDLYKWDQSLYEDKILSAESKKLMFTPGLSNYGYGVGISDEPIGKTEEKTKIIAHGGGINGFNSLLTRAVDKRQTVIILDNVGLGNYHHTITNSIISILNGQPPELPKKSIAETLYKTAIEKDVAAAIAEYRKLKAENSPIYDFSETELNTVGYRLVGQKRPKDAIEIFKLNVEMFPTSANPYDSLGEAYLADGQKDLALVNYKKAAELDPKNANALLIVRRLEGKEIKVDAAILDAYVGEYQVNPRLTLTITKEGDKLFGQMTGQAKLAVEPVSDTQFTMPDVKANITFEKDADGKVVGLVLSQGSRTANAKKIK